jgi:hypothetical protein
MSTRLATAHFPLTFLNYTQPDHLTLHPDTTSGHTLQLAVQMMRADIASMLRDRKCPDSYYTTPYMARGPAFVKPCQIISV